MQICACGVVYHAWLCAVDLHYKWNNHVFQELAHVLHGGLWWLAMSFPPPPLPLFSFLYSDSPSSPPIPSSYFTLSHKPCLLCLFMYMCAYSLQQDSNKAFCMRNIHRNIPYEHSPWAFTTKIFHEHYPWTVLSVGIMICNMHQTCVKFLAIWWQMWKNEMKAFHNHPPRNTLCSVQLHFTCTELSWCQ